EFSGRNEVNRWFRAAYWVGRFVCELVGALLVGGAVILAITGLTSVRLPLVGAVLIVTALICFIVGNLVIGGLAVAGKIAQGNEETREWARSWGRPRGAARARSAEEVSLSE
ncbi:MAG TPA: hypothetical protein VFU69_13720, partial [Ktedonobacterales bacterium]|nr:hypothetical protein [Ktedonobacterales bacterium]